jgi:5-methylcytosine-specific restriction endonuclease McrA
MSDILVQKVLVINRSWQGIAETDVQTAMCDIVRGVATAIDTSEMLAVPWEVWSTLPVRDGDRSLRTIHGLVRVPTVICKAKYAKMPKRRPKLDRRGIGERDGKICQYTGQLAPDGTLDHVMPRSRGGRDVWENVVWCQKELNHRKGNRTPQEAGLALRRKPSQPVPKPVCVMLRPKHPDWEPFLMLK